MLHIIERILHTGSATCVASATHRDNGTRVVLKFPRKDVPAPAILERLRHEYAILRDLEVPGIIRALALEPHAAGLALVLEHWGDTSLNRIIAAGPLPVGTALRLGVALAHALGQVHRKGIIHRDIKPRNVLVNQERTQVRLIDFGIALRSSRQLDAAGAEVLAGTLGYMAPEQTGRMDCPLDIRADLYAFGVTLYEMLTGRLPFETADVAELIHAHIARPPIPAHERAPERRIPELVSDIVQKLMAKNPEHRYQTAEGAAYDLERAACAWEETGTVARFALATQDWENSIRKPSRLYGREVQLAKLKESLSQAFSGKVVLSLVGGPSGVGKSALVHALYTQVKERGGTFAYGRFDQLQRSTPYSALSQAFRSIVRRRLATSADQLARWRQVWQEAAGANLRILVDLMPELVHMLGEPKPLVEVGPLEAQNRFRMTVQRFVWATATAEHPLFLFVDDLQWADPATLVLLREIATAPQGRYLMLVGTYRSDEMDAAHPLHTLLDAAKAAGVTIDSFTLSPLEETALRDMVADMLNRPAKEVAELSRLVKERTDGSPFFVGQFLHALHAQGLLIRDLGTGQWLWQREAIERAGLTDNVVTLLAKRLMELPSHLQNLLQLAACIGNHFDLELVEQLVEQSPDAVRELLEEAVREGLIERDAHDAPYAFVHDRLRQAAYEALLPAERMRTHLLIGRQLRTRYGKACHDNELFETLYHRNRAVELLTDIAEKVDLAEQNLRAGQRAKASTAYAEAMRFLSIGQTLLGEDGWTQAPQLTLEMHLGLAKAAMLAGQPKEGERLFRLCMERFVDPLDKAYVVSCWIPLLVLSAQYSLGLELGVTTLASLGVVVPHIREEQQALFLSLMDELEVPLGKMTAADWMALPTSQSRIQELTCQLLESTALMAATIGQRVFSSLSLAMIVRETLRSGLVKNSLNGLGGVAEPLLHLYGKVRLARQLIDAAQAAQQSLGGSQATIRMLSAIVYQYVGPLAKARELFQLASPLAKDEGQLMFADFSRMVIEHMDVLSGAHLFDLSHRLKEQGSAIPFVQENYISIRAVVDFLCQGGAPDQSEEAVEAALSLLTSRSSMAPMNTFYANAMASFAGLHLGADSWALRTAIAVEPLWGTGMGYPPCLVFVFALCVAAPQALPMASAEERAVWKEKLSYYGARLTLWAESCAETFLHMRLLMDAGCARLEGRLHEAEHLYIEAIEDAHRNGFLSSEALGMRLLGELYLAQKRPRVAQTCLRDAHDTYLRWGAHAPAMRMRAKYPQVFPELVTTGRGLPEAVPVPRSGEPVANTSTSSDSLNAQLDATAMLRAAQALSGELVLSSLIGRMLRLLTENAGADRTVLALMSGDALVVRAELRVEHEQLVVDLNEPIDGSTRLPATLVHYVARSKEPVVLGQSIDDRRFEDDPYWREHHPASMLAVPLVHQGRLSGVLVLEHSRAANTFAQQRVALVTLLASQAATAVENARLYQDLQAANAGLEAKVTERTVALDKALKDLWAEMDLAQKIQRTLLPPAQVFLKRYEFAGLMKTADQVGGDYYDAFEAGGKLWLLVGDVSGHGISAGLIMMMVQTAVRSLVGSFADAGIELLPSRLLTLLNRAVWSNLQLIGKDQYMTMTALCIDERRIVQSGLHQSSLILRGRTGQVQEVESQGVWLGVLDEIAGLNEDHYEDFAPGDVLVLYTDGLTEARPPGEDKSLFTVVPVIARLAQTGRANASSDEIVRRILALTEKSAIRDDISVVALRHL